MNREEFRAAVFPTMVEKVALEREVERLRAEIIRHGWSLDCPRCAALIDGDGSGHD